MEKIKSQLYDLDENIDNYLFYDKEKYEEEVAYAIGEEKGIEKGIEQGIKQGIEQGVEQTQKDMIQRLTLKGFTIDEIHDMLDISLEIIQKVLTEEPKN